MTELSKIIRRRSGTVVRGRSLIIELRPGATDLIVVRESGRRKGYAVPLGKVYELGARIEADENRRIRAAKKKERAKNRIRA